MPMTKEIATDLLTPLGAYLRLREGAPAAFLLESVERGRLEPTVPLPANGPGFDESRFVVPELLVRFDHARGIAEVLVGDSAEAARLLEAPQPDAPRGTGARGELQRFPDRDEYL